MDPGSAAMNAPSFPSPAVGDSPRLHGAALAPTGLAMVAYAVLLAWLARRLSLGQISYDQALLVLAGVSVPAGAIYLAKQIEQEGRSLKDVTPVLSRIGEAKFKQMVRPGDVITIEVTMKETVSKFYFMKGKVLKGAKPALTIEFALAMIEE